MSEYENDPYNIRAVNAIGGDTTAYDPYTIIPSEKRKKQGKVVKDVDLSPTGLFFRTLQQTNPGAAKALSVVSSVAKGTVDIVDSIGDCKIKRDYN